MRKLFSTPTTVAVATVVLLACQYVECKYERRAIYHDRRSRDTRKFVNTLEVHNPDFNIGMHHYLRIRGGNLTDTLNYPYIAAVFIKDMFWCAGVVVDVNWILTAAHCLNYVLHVSPLTTLEEIVSVRVGSPVAVEGGQRMKVVAAVRHPKFEEEPAPHADVALMKLEKNLEFNQHVNLIKIYEGMEEPFAQSFITITGWGATNGSETAFQEASPYLQTARLKVREQEYCSDSYQLVNGFMFTRDLFCASLRNGSRDACLFDAGAPAVQNNKLVGLMSFGPERCNTLQPAVFTKAFYFRDFVKSTIASYKTPADLIEAMADLKEDLPENDSNGKQSSAEAGKKEETPENEAPPAAPEEGEE